LNFKFVETGLRQTCRQTYNKPKTNRIALSFLVIFRQGAFDFYHLFTLQNRRGKVFSKLSKVCRRRTSDKNDDGGMCMPPSSFLSGLKPEQGLKIPQLFISC
jgi:hypothetical protein